MLKQHNEPLPYLREYLAELGKVDTTSSVMLFFASMFLLALIGILSILGAPVGAVLSLLISSAIGIGVVVGVVRKKAKSGRTTHQYEQHKRVVLLSKQMLYTKRLHKAIDAGSAHLLEESARYWREIKSSLEGPSWSGTQLPSHWKNVKTQALTATDEAMEEMLLLLQGSFHPYAGPQGLRANVENVVETFVTGPRFREADMLPAEFEPARKLAEKLKLLAKQIREATQDVAREAVILTPQEDVAAALDMAISDIRNIQSAEIELRNNA
jgi:hypothetical protein